MRDVVIVLSTAILDLPSACIPGETFRSEADCGEGREVEACPDGKRCYEVTCEDSTALCVVSGDAGIGPGTDAGEHRDGAAGGDRESGNAGERGRCNRIVESA